MKIDWENEKDNLEKLILENVPYEKIGKIYGVTGNAIKKAAKKLNIQLTSRRSINNKEHFNKGVVLKEKSLNEKPGYDRCPICGGLKFHKSELCSDCRNKERKEWLRKQTLGYFIDGQKYLTSKCGEIRKDARRVLEESSREKVCAYCHNHEFDSILEAHHLKGILEFDSTTTIKEINSETNLVWLCPNHHRMLELGLIEL